MKHIATLLIILLVIPVALAGRQLPNEAYQGGRTTITFTLEGAVVGERAVVAEQLSEGSELIDWKITGGEEVIHIVNEQEHIWSFIATNQEPRIDYIITLPTTQSITLDAVFALPPNNYGQITDRLRLQALVVHPPRIEAETQEPATVEVATKKRAASLLRTIVFGLFMMGAAGFAYFMRQDDHFNTNTVHEAEAVQSNFQQQQQNYDQAETTSSWQQQEWEQQPTQNLQMQEWDSERFR